MAAPTDNASRPPAAVPEGFEFLFPTDQSPLAFFSPQDCVAGSLNPASPGVPRQRLDEVTSVWLSYPSTNFEHEANGKYAAEFPLRAALPGTATDAHRQRLEDLLHSGRGLLYLRRVDAAENRWEVVAFLESGSGLGEEGWSVIGLKGR
jgi:hypothetical protein